MTALTSLADLKAALLAAASDDVLTLAAGDYSELRLTAGAKVGSVTIQAEPGATIAGLNLTSCAGLCFVGVTLTAPLSISKSERITFTAGRIAPPNYANGGTIRQSKDVEVSYCEIVGIGNSLSFYNNPIGGETPQTGLRLIGNWFHGVRGPDVIDIYSSCNVLVDRNTIEMDCYVGSGHPDALQVDSPVKDAKGVPIRTRNVVITDNVFIRTNDPAPQPDGSRSDPAQGIAFVAHADDVTIRGNANFGAAANGISVAGCRRGLVEDNLVLGVGAWSKITVRSQSDSVMVRNNVANDVGVYAPSGVAPSTNVAFEGNKEIPAAAGLEDRAVFDAWLAAHPDCGSPLATHLRPAPPAKPKTAEELVAELEARIAAMTAEELTEDQAHEAQRIANEKRIAEVTAALEAEAHMHSATKRTLELVLADGEEDRAAMEVAVAALRAALASRPQAA